MKFVDNEASAPRLKTKADRMDRKERNSRVHGAPGTTKVAFFIRGVKTTKHTKGRLDALLKFDWENPTRHDWIPPHKMWARILEVDPSRLTAKFHHRPNRVVIMLDVAEENFQCRK